MKKRLLPLLLSLLLLASSLPLAAAAEGSTVVALKLGSPWCVVGGEVVQVDADNAQVLPKVVQIPGGGCTLLPIRRVLEAFGGTVEWLPPNGVSCLLGETKIDLNVGDAFAMVNGARVDLDVPAQADNNRTFVPLRFVSENLGLHVEWEGTNQVVVISDAPLDPSSLTSLPEVKKLVEKTTPKTDPLSLRGGSFSLPSGTVSAQIITVDMKDPRVSVRAALPDGKLNNTRAFSSIVSQSGAQAVINANFFNSYDAVKDPVGHLMADGQFLYASSGGSTLGITADNKLYFGQPSVFVHIRTADGGAAQLWDVFEVNVLKQFANQAVLYTPARGASFPVTYPGYVLTCTGGVSSDYRAVSVGETVSIPADGFVAYFSTEVASTTWHATPEMGRKLEIEPYLFVEDKEGFTLNGVKAIVGGGPRLVKDGVIVTELEGDFAYDNRFKGSYAAPRTAIGATADNKLLLVSVTSATIQQMRELMSTLGCVDAFNLDGGGSTGMYFRGQTLYTPGRELTATLQVFVDG